MTLNIRSAAILLFLICAPGGNGLPRGARAEEGTAGNPETAGRVEQTFNQSPFDYRSASLEKRNGYRILRLTYPSPVKTEIVANNTIPADYYLPEGAEQGPKRPAVIVLHILNGNFELERLLCTSLAVRGIPALMFKLPYYGERAMPGGKAELAKRPDLFAAALPQGLLDARRTIDLLASRSEVNPDKIGITGISLGGIVSATAAGSDPRIHRAVLLLAGGDLPAILAHARETRQVREFLDQQSLTDRAKYEAVMKEVDPLSCAAGLCERAKAGRVLMLNAREDDVIPPACTNKLAEALGIKDRVVWFEGLGHYTAIAALPQTFKRTVDFFALDLPDGAKPPEVEKPSADSPRDILAKLVRELIDAAGEPMHGRCHLIDLAAKVTDKSGKQYEGHLRLVRGDGHKFRIEFKVPQVGEGMWGQDTGPWIASAQHIYRGAKQPQPTDALRDAEPKHVAKFQALAAGLSGLLMLPGIVEQTLEIKQDNRDAETALLVRLKDRKKEDFVRLVLDADHRPAQASFNISGTQGEVVCRVWRMNTVAPDELFQPPTDRAEQPVESADLYRIFAATFNFVMELAP